ncbi:SNF2 family N-terminal domain-containing protein [Apiosordaria backusii]|uniref:SNF2 family N-terminal domain-containing protein n=1 Tax=Apiosordaria backusii TaxID=314023 RepID=A0AA40ENF0_9PEZI|nr:SNF2 family N-terminal domain-containing protein [Apiosordaria backusii]
MAENSTASFSPTQVFPLQLAWNSTSIFSAISQVPPLQFPWSANLIETSPLTVVAVVLLTAYALLYYAQTIPLAKDEPPIIPSRIPFLGHVLGMLLQGGRYVKNIGLDNPHLPIFTLPVPFSRIYIVTSPSLASSVQRLPRSLSFAPLVPDITKRVLGLNAKTVEIVRQNIDPLPGEQAGFLADIHDLVEKSFGPGEEMLKLASSAAEELKQLVGEYVPNPDNKEIDLLVWIRHFVAVATAKFLYGERNPLVVEPELEEAFWDFDHGLGGLLVGIWPSMTARRAYRGRERLVKAFERWLLEGGYTHESVAPIIKQRVEIALRHGWALKEVARSEVSFLFAGIVNTATTTFWGVLQVCNDQRLLERIREELDVQRDTEKIVLVGLKDKRMLEAVVKECLRLNSDTYSTRLVVPKEGVEMNAKGDRYWFKGGAVVQISGGTIHASRGYWGEDVKEFKPERFLEGDQKWTVKGFRAFGGGKTLCPGRHFAVTTIKALIAMIVTRFEIEIVGEKLPEKDDGILPVHVLEPKERVMVKVRVRDEGEFAGITMQERKEREVDVYSQREATDTTSKKTRAELRQSFYDLIQSTTISYSSPSTTTSRTTNFAAKKQDNNTVTMVRPARKASFSDDDLDFLSSQAANMSIGPTAQTPARRGGQASFGNNNNNNNSFNTPGSVIDLTNSPAPAAPTPVPTFGHPTQLPSRFAPQQQQQQQQRNKSHDHLFIQRKTRPEFHADLYRNSGPLKPKNVPKKPDLPMFSSLSAEAQPVHQYTKPAGGSYGETTFYTDPAKANADLKALLEGGMEDEEEDDITPPKDAAKTAAKDEKKPAEEPEKEPEEGVQEDGTLTGIKVKLLPHQVVGVKWMKNRELGPLKKGRVPKGGILADDMGLGKTLQSISLIISNPMPKSDEAGYKKHFSEIKRGTLVVAPLALIRQWEAEIKEKVDKDILDLKVCVHHGPQRTKDAKQLGKYDVVITTYQILVSEHGNSHPDPAKSPQVGCFGVHWYRVILDEAHSIKNRNAKATKACCGLRAEYRWCLTGTPMQNNLDELQSLVHFLRVPPYNELAEWRKDIDGPMKQGKGHVAINRLHNLLRCFMKRRTKEILKEEGALVAGGKKALDKMKAKMEEDEENGEERKEMPKPAFKITERKVVTVETRFSEGEREFYDALEARADKSLERMMKGRIDYANALVLLLRLRQACNHPRLTDTKLEKDQEALAVDSTAQVKTKGGDDLDDLADAFGGMGIQTRKCEMCLSELSKKEMGSGQVKCSDCIDSMQKVINESPSKKKKKKKDGRRVSVVKEEIKIEKVAASKKRLKARRIVEDSDEEEEEGSWLVGEDQQGALRLGKCGGSEDENAEGGGDDIASEDSEHSSEEDDEDGSQLDSFIVKDESQVDAPGSGSDSDSDSEDDDTFVSVSKLSQSQVVSQRDAEDSDEDDEEISASELHSSESDDSEEDSDDDLPNQRRSRRPGQQQPKERKKKSKSVKKSNGITQSAKIRELLSILRKEAHEHKFIVFSQFTSMLDLIEPFLRSQAGMKAVRYDGKMPNDAREAALKALRTDPHTRILLCSLKCGSLGLNLTAATRVVIVEPFWNPFVEEQAIDRVHRLTQTVDVIVYKLTVQDTVEARIVELQNKKRMLAEATIEGGMRKKGKNQLKLGLQEILDLFKHDARASLGVDDGLEGNDERNVVRDVGEFVSGKHGVRRPGAKREHDVYGRRW